VSTQIILDPLLPSTRHARRQPPGVGRRDPPRRPQNPGDGRRRDGSAIGPGPTVTSSWWPAAWARRRKATTICWRAPLGRTGYSAPWRRTSSPGVRVGGSWIRCRPTPANEKGVDLIKAPSPWRRSPPCASQVLWPDPAVVASASQAPVRRSLCARQSDDAEAPSGVTSGPTMAGSASMLSNLVGCGTTAALGWWSPTQDVPNF